MHANFATQKNLSVFFFCHSSVRTCDKIMFCWCSVTRNICSRVYCVKCSADANGNGFTISFSDMSRFETKKKTVFYFLLEYLVELCFIFCMKYFPCDIPFGWGSPFFFFRLSAFFALWLWKIKKKRKSFFERYSFPPMYAEKNARKQSVTSKNQITNRLKWNCKILSETVLSIR